MGDTAKNLGKIVKDFIAGLVELMSPPRAPVPVRIRPGRPRR